MKTNKLGLLAMLALGGLVTFSPLAQAQEKSDEKKPAPPAGGKGNPQDRMKQIEKELNLTDEQKQKTGPIFKEQAEKMRAIFTDANASQEEKRTKIQELRTTYSAKIKAILTPEQAEKWDKMQEQMGKGGKKKQS